MHLDDCTLGSLILKLTSMWNVHYIDVTKCLYLLLSKREHFRHIGCLKNRAPYIRIRSQGPSSTEGFLPHLNKEPDNPLWVYVGFGERDRRVNRITPFFVEKLFFFFSSESLLTASQRHRNENPIPFPVMVPGVLAHLRIKRPQGPKGALV